jgi:hypothetical protein
VKNAASSAAPILSDHAAQNLRTTSMGLSIWLLLRSIFGEPSKLHSDSVGAQTLLARTDVLAD